MHFGALMFSCIVLSSNMFLKLVTSGTVPLITHDVSILYACLIMEIWPFVMSFLAFYFWYFLKM